MALTRACTGISSCFWVRSNARLMRRARSTCNRENESQPHVPSHQPLELEGEDYC